MKYVGILVCGVLLGGFAVWSSNRRSAASVPPVVEASSTRPSADSPRVIAAAQGRVEGRSESVEVGASANGVIKALLFGEGDLVEKDAILGEIACDNIDSEIRALEASIASIRQSRLLLLRGGRDEERLIAAQSVRAAEAVVEQARLHLNRMTALISAGDVPRQNGETARRDVATAEAALEASLEKQKLVSAGPLPEEVSRIDADIVEAVEKQRTAVARREKCTIRAPIGGTVTRVNLHAGEAYSTVMPRPIITLTDLSQRRIRAEVDERDLSRIRLNQRVRVSAEGLQASFTGRVTGIAAVMGRKTAVGRDPAEKVDRDILETLITPDHRSPPLPIGLRVVIEFEDK